MSAKDKKRGKVLAVDDDRVTLEVARERLEAAGFEVITRDNALGTSAVILKEKPDLVLLDVRMPGLTGDALSKLIASSTSVILHSASDAEALAKMASACGAVGFIVKTADDTAFVTQFQRYVMSRRAATSSGDPNAGR